MAHENGAIEGPHRHWKLSLEQKLIQRGSRDFETETEYRQLVADVTASLNGRYEVAGKLEMSGYACNLVVGMLVWLGG